MEPAQVVIQLIPVASLVLYILGLGVYWIMAFFILYHLIRFGVSTKPKQLALVFLFGSIILSLITTVLFVR